MMPGLSAEDFINEAHKKSPYCKVMLITVLDNIKEIAKNLHVHCCLKKPFVPERLLELIDAK